MDTLSAQTKTGEFQRPLHRAKRQDFADSARQVRDALLYPLLVDSILAQRMMLYERFAVLLRAGLSVSQALGSLQEVGGTGRYSATLRAAQHATMDGALFSDVVRRRPDLFPRIEVELIAAGERSGHLDEMVTQAAQWLKHEIELRRFLSMHTLYAKLSYVAGTVVIPLFITFILGGDVAGLAQNIALRWLIFFAWIAIIVTGVRRAIVHWQDTAAMWERFVGALPVLGNTAQRLAMSRFLRAFAVLMDAGFPPAECIEIAGESTGRVLFARTTREIADEVRREVPVSVALRKLGKIPSAMEQALETGFASGEVRTVLIHACKQVDDETSVTQFKTAFVFSQAFYLVVALMLAGGALGSLGVLLPH
jgi:type II secretory pathway component PulF